MVRHVKQIFAFCRRGYYNKVEKMRGVCAGFGRRGGSYVLTLLGVLPVFALAQSVQVVNPALQSLSEYYAGIPYSVVLLLSSLVSLVVIPCSALAGGLAGRKVGYRALALTAMACVLVGGALPYWVMGSFPLTLICRMAVGVGIGIASPLSSALVMRLLPPERQAFWQGAGTAVMNLCGVCYQSLAGVVCLWDVRYIWLVYGIVLIPLLLTLFFLKEPPAMPPAPAARGKGKLPAGTLLTCGGFGLLYLFLSPVLLNISSILVGEGLGSSATAGAILSAYSAGGMAAGFVFGGVYKLLGRMTIPVSLLLQAAGLAGCAFGRSAALIGAGTVLFGVAIHWIWPACIMEFSRLPDGKGALASGLFISALNIGTFLGSPFIGLVEMVSGSADPRLPVIAGFAGTLLVAAAWAGCKLKAKR